MANIKFSAFNTETNSANVDFLVGYQGTTMKKISPSNLSSVTSLNDLSDVIVNNTDQNAYFIELPASRSGDLGNLGIGIDALEALTSGKYNTAIGADALNTLTTSQGVTAVGYNAGAASGTTLMGGATLIGRNAGFGRSGYRNIAIGEYAMGFGSAKTNVNKNTAIGYHALYRIDTNGEDNIAIGHETSQFLTTAVENIAIGDNTARNSTADGLLAIGHQAAYSNTSGVGSTIVGYQAGYTATTGGDNSFFGYHAGRYVTGNDNTAIGREAMEGTAVATNEYFNVAVGYGSLTNCAGAFQCATLGHSAGNSITSGSNLTVLGYNAQPSSATATNEITLGNASAALLRIPGLGSTDGHVLTYETASGGIVLKAAGGGGASDLNGLSDCLVDTASVYIANVPAGLSGNPQGNLVVGANAGNAITTGTNSTLIGTAAGLTGTAITQCTYVGKSAGSGSTICQDNVIMGYQAGLYNNNKNFNVYIGSDAGYLRGNRNVAVGYKAFNTFVADINDSVALGYHAGITATSAADSLVLVGREAGKTAQSVGTVAVGYQAGYSHTTATGATYLGYQAGYGVTTAVQNTLIGYEAGMDASLLAGGVVAIGYQAGKEFEIGDGAVLVGRHAGAGNGSPKQETVFIGDGAGRYISSAFNTAVGAGALRGGTSGGSSAANNTAVGRLAMYQITTGDDNVAVGYNAGSTIDTGSDNVVIGKSADVSAAGAVNQIVIGDTSVGNGDNTITLGNGSITGLHCQVSTISALSDKRDKTNIEDSNYGLNIIDSLNPVIFEWNQRDGNRKGLKDLGFIAQDLQKVDDKFLQLVDSKDPEKLQASYGRLIPVLVKAIQELKEEIEQLKKS